MRALSALAVAAALLVVRASAQETRAVVVHLADGSSFPLAPWSLSYEFQTFAQGTSPAFAKIERADTAEVRAAKKAYPLAAGSTLEVRYENVEREIEVADQTQRVKVPVARLFVLSGPDGKKTEIRVEHPHRDLLVPGADKSLVVQARSLDLRGQTLTGTKRDFCLASYLALVECRADPDHQVVRIEFPR